MRSENSGVSFAPGWTSAAAERGRYFARATRASARAFQACRSYRSRWVPILLTSSRKKSRVSGPASAFRIGPRMRPSSNLRASFREASSTHTPARVRNSLAATRSNEVPIEDLSEMPMTASFGLYRFKVLPRSRRNRFLRDGSSRALLSEKERKLVDRVGSLASAGVMGTGAMPKPSRTTCPEKRGERERPRIGQQETPLGNACLRVIGKGCDLSRLETLRRGGVFDTVTSPRLAVMGGEPVHGTNAVQSTPMNLLF